MRVAEFEDPLIIKTISHSLTPHADAFKLLRRGSRLRSEGFLVRVGVERSVCGMTLSRASDTSNDKHSSDRHVSEWPQARLMKALVGPSPTVELS